MQTRAGTAFTVGSDAAARHRRRLSAYRLDIARDTGDNELVSRPGTSNVRIIVVFVCDFISVQSPVMHAVVWGRVARAHVCIPEARGRGEGVDVRSRPDRHRSVSASLSAAPDIKRDAITSSLEHARCAWLRFGCFLACVTSVAAS